MKEYVYVFDYSVGQIFEIDCSKYKSDESIIEFYYEDILTQAGFNIDNCYWMVVDEKLDIIRC